MSQALEVIEGLKDFSQKNLPIQTDSEEIRKAYNNVIVQDLYQICTPPSKKHTIKTAVKLIPKEDSFGRTNVILNHNFDYLHKKVKNLIISATDEIGEKNIERLVNSAVQVSKEYDFHLKHVVGHDGTTVGFTYEEDIANITAGIISRHKRLLAPSMQSDSAYPNEALIFFDIISDKDLIHDKQDCFLIKKKIKSIIPK